MELVERGTEMKSTGKLDASQQFPLGAIRTTLACLLCTVATGGQSRAGELLPIQNPGEHTVYIKLRPASDRKQGWTKDFTLPPGKTTEIPLNFKDPYDLLLRLGTDKLYVPLEKPIPLRKALRQAKEAGLVFLLRTFPPEKWLIEKYALKLSFQDQNTSFLMPYKGGDERLRAARKAIWKLTGTDPKRNRTNGTLRLKGEGGTFQFNRRSGALSQVRYCFDKDQIIIDGQWQARVDQRIKSGTFLLSGSLKDPKKVSGIWREANGITWKITGGDRINPKSSEPKKEVP